MTPKKIAGFAIGPIGGALLGFISLPVTTWFFAVEDIGRVSMLQVTVSFCVMFFGLGLDQAYVREFHEKPNSPQLLKNVVLPGFLPLVAAIGVFLFFPEKLSFWLFDIESSLLGSLVLICLLSAFISRFLSLILRMQEKGLAFSMSQVLPKAFFLLLIGSYILSKAEFTTFQLLAAHTFSILIVCLIFAWNTRSDWIPALKASFETSQAKEMLRYSIPLVFGGLAYWGLTAMDKVFLRSMSSLEELGVYSVAVSFAAAATIFQSIFTTVWVPTVYKWVAAGENLNKVENTTRYVLFFIVIIFCFAGLFSWIIDYIIPEQYSSVKYIFIACLGAPLFFTLSETTHVGISVTRRTSFALYASLIALVSNLLGNYLLVPHFGAGGAAVSTCFSFWVFFLFRTEFSMYVWRKSPRFNIYFFTLACLVLASFTSLFGSSYDYVLVIFWLALLFLTVLFFYDTAKNILYYCFVTLIRTGN